MTRYCLALDLKEDPFGIYAPLHELIVHLEEEKFIKPGMREIVQWTTSVDDALKACGV